MVKGKPGEWYRNDHIGGFFNEKGELVVCVEYGLTDAEIGKHAVDVQNGDGYYDDEGRFRRFGKE